MLEDRPQHLALRFRQPGLPAEAGNIPIVSNASRGGVFNREALVLVQGRAPRSESRREPHIGGGATSVFLYDEYAYGERSPGNWLYGVLSDATAPTS
jgi:hypothetical protein